MGGQEMSYPERRAGTRPAPTALRRALSFTAARALLFISFCVLLLVGVFPVAFTQDHTRPRKTSREDGAGGAQSQPGRKTKQDAEAVDDDEVVRINASEVLVPATVRDSAGRLVSDLTRKDFRVLEDGREQPLSDLSLRQVPVDVALLVDASSSVAESFEDFRHAAEQFAARLDREDRFCLVKFDDRVELLLDWSKRSEERRVGKECR